MLNDMSSNNESLYEPTNCIFYNSITHSCRFCQETGLDCPGEGVCEMFYNKNGVEYQDPNSMSILGLSQSFEIQQKQRTWLAEALVQLKQDYAQLLADKNSKEEKLMQARAENTRLHEENRRVSLRFANSANEAPKVANLDKIKELGAMQQQIQILTAAKAKLEADLAQAQAENTALKIDNGVLTQARSYLNQNQPNYADQERLTTIMHELSDKLLKGNQELTTQLLANNQEIGDKLLSNSKELGDTIVSNNKDLSEKLLADSEEQKKNSHMIADQVKQVRSRLDNVDNNIANIDDNNTTFKIMIAMIIGGLLGVLAGLGCYRMFFM